MKIEGINVDDLRDQIEGKFQELCGLAQLGGVASLAELADVTGMMSDMMQVVDDIAGEIIKNRPPSNPHNWILRCGLCNCTTHGKTCNFDCACHDNAD